MKIARRVTEVAPSLTLEITSLARKMKEQGGKIVNFAAGEPDSDTPEYIKKAAIEAIEQGFTKYTPAAGWPKLKEAISKKFKKENQLSYSPEQIVVSCGAKHALYNILQVLCEKEDEVIIASPYWVSYPEMVKLAGATAHIVQTQPQNQFKLDKRSLASAITKKTKAVILNSPANPTGSVYSQDELEEICALAVERNFYIISDEIYEKFIFDGKKHISCASLNEEIYRRTIVVNGVSKSYSMTGWRIGYLASPDEKIIQAIKKLQSHSTSNPCSISQKAAYQALEKTDKTQMQKMLKSFQERRDCMLRGLDEISGLSYIKPEGAFYVFCDISQLKLDSITFCRKLLEEAEIAAVPGEAFGRDDYIRLSFATSRNEIEEGLRRLKKWVTR
ncbi:MAG: pyridoxal phosphate-dependent aminotransferase [Candidatus Omnitrophota bacterium]|nr:MAG: pyridoxal phosphate-dependent aminotransferase [Candidatus Omnitrophota bacterium]